MRNFEEEYGLIRFLHAVPDSDAVDVYINDTLFFKEIRFTQFSPYVYIPKGKYNMEVYNVDTTENPILRGNIEVENGELATIAATGNSNDLEFVTIKEDKERAQRGYSKIRVVHLSPNAPEVNILIDKNMLFKDVEFRDISDYVEILAGDYRLDVEAVASGRILRSNQKTINPDRIYTFYALGNLPNVQIFQSLDGATFIAPSAVE
ncbi:DUF4397 domain-containing protein [[Clostridium] dakarense]|uniref:DUF4397 domain-containing protein n=1 Tax=Faecalimicrobium dakarense TaxID=1301100 RepID=UPI0004B8DFBD|nr:DUF4397 domain-containing protein [[Clostridium] dakarense]